MALKLIEKYKVDKKECAELLKTHENQVTAYSISGHKVQEKQITTGYNLLTTDPNPESSQGIKRDLDNEVDEEEYDAKRTIIGGKSTSWIVNGINIYQRLTEYQETGLPKTRPEYYDDDKTEDNIEKKTKSFLNNIITRDIKETKKNLKLQKNDT
ncbi:2169_t:CDS:2, partial [Racocetra fulgida]